MTILCQVYQRSLNHFLPQIHSVALESGIYVYEKKIVWTTDRGHWTPAAAYVINAIYILPIKSSACHNYNCFRLGSGLYSRA